jgi:transcriptional regulator with XRE-family HTH domain
MRDSDICKAFGRAVRSNREAKGISQEKLAEMADLNRNYIGMVERAERNASITAAKGISSALGMPLAVLIAQTEARMRR